MNESRNGYWSNQETVDPQIRALRQELIAELRAYDSYQRQSRSAQTRQMAQEILDEGMRRGFSTQKIQQMLSEQQSRGTMGYRVKSLINSPQGRSFMWGVGATLAGLVLIPTSASRVRPLARKAVEGAMVLSDQVQDAMAREEIEDIVAEARFENFKRSMDPVDPSPTGETH